VAHFIDARFQGMAASKVQRDFNVEDIVEGPRVYVRRQVYYTGHATTTYSVEQASTIIDYIGSKTGCDHCLPFALRLVEGGEMISIAEGNVPEVVTYMLYSVYCWWHIPVLTL